jgi:hypothetical protein
MEGLPENGYYSKQGDQPYPRLEKHPRTRSKNSAGHYRTKSLTKHTVFRAFNEIRLLEA